MLTYGNLKMSSKNPRLPKELTGKPRHLPKMPENVLDYSDMERLGDAEVLKRAAANLSMEQAELKRIVDVYHKNMLLCITEGYVVTVPNVASFHTRIREPREGVRGVLSNGFERIEQWTVVVHTISKSIIRRIVRKNAKYIRETHGHEALFKPEPNKLLERNYFYNCIDRPKSERWASSKNIDGSSKKDNTET
jgi:nucleoid DNA-binding protein